MTYFSIIPRSIPIAIKVPLAVAGLMIAVGLLLSQLVLSRLEDTQERFLDALSQSYLDGIASAIGPSLLRDDSWEIFDAIERAQTNNRSLLPVETIVTNADNRVVAASDPRRHAIGAKFDRGVGDGRIVFDEAGAIANVSRRIAYPGRTAGTIYVAFDTRHLTSERKQVALALLLTNGVLVLCLAAAGWLLMRRMLSPVRILSDHLGAARLDQAEQISGPTIQGAPGEFRRLFRSYNALVRSMLDRENLAQRLAEERRVSSLGRLASSVAHEINNPLGGLFNAVATLKSHGHLAGVRENSVGLLDRGLRAIRDTVRTTLSVHRTDHEVRPLERRDLDDLAMLVVPESTRRGVRVIVANDLGDDLQIPSTPIRQAVLNLLLNAIAATPPEGIVSLTAHSDNKRLIFSVEDQGPGFPDWAVPILTNSGPLPPSNRGGLGLWTIGRFVADLGGAISIATSDCGSAVRIEIPRRDGRLADAA